MKLAITLTLATLALCCRPGGHTQRRPVAPCRDASPFGTSNRSRSIAGASKGKAHGAWAWDARQTARTAVWAEQD
ncbi:hypothetical protein MDA_GLEAN10009079 [Myotis davidii]|uniref:Uncharacterized protein n=1 Tax=Myotis davidii TaxID=225400 RepID=L5LC47_MYODS|nr:hypothetical protein MDA_GLEAN10009079 [Myotis davidii]